MNQRVVPQLRMTDWDRSRAFYCDGLGFEVEWIHRFAPQMPAFVKLTRDGMSIFVTEHTGDCKVGGAVYFYIDDVDALHRELSDRGVQPKEPPADTPWKLREMQFIDPDGNKLRFGSPLAS